MIITQEKLIKEISCNEDIDITTVRDIFRSAENIIFAYLSSTTPSENIIIKILDGLSLKSEYIPEHQINKGMFQKHSCPDQIRIKPNITKYYNNKINLQGE